MRSFTLSITIIITLFAAACGSDDDTNCSQTSGCTEPDGGVTGSCGDGVCSADHGEDVGNCSKDCSGVCLNPANPVYCEDDLIECNPAGTDCDLPIPPYSCPAPVRCPSNDVAWNCCDSGTNNAATFWCPISAPYWCPSTGSCKSNKADCAYGAGNQCYYSMVSCQL